MATEFGKRLRDARKFAKMTQKDAEKETGIPQSTISTAEREGESSTETVTYARAYKVNPDWLATGEGRMEIDDVNTSHPAKPLRWGFFSSKGFR
jgi:transcriptional regulator with XRE-family HTH domain